MLSQTPCRISAWLLWILCLFSVSTTGQECLPEIMSQTADIPTDVSLVASTAYITRGEAGLLIADLSDPTKPTLLGSVDTPGRAVEVEVSNGVAYVAAGRYAGLQVIDVADPERPRVMGSVGARPAGAPGRMVEIAVATVDIVYIVRTIFPDTFLEVVDVENPVAPEIVRTVTIDRATALGIEVSGDRAYLPAQRINGVDPASTSCCQLLELDIGDPRSPRTVRTIRDAGRYVEDVAVVEEIAYLAWSNNEEREGQIGLGLLDLVTDRFLGMVETPGNPLEVTVSGQFVYLAEEEPESGLRIIDVADPANPRIHGSLDMRGDVSNIAVSGGISCVVEGPESSFFNIEGTRSTTVRVIDVSDPRTPERIADVMTFVQVSSDIAVSNGLAYVTATEPYASHFPPEQGGLQIIDVRNPERPAFRSWVETPDPRARAVALSEEAAYVAAADLHIIDIQDPENPTIIATVETPSTAMDVAVDGDVVFVAGTRGVHAIEVADPETPRTIDSIEIPGVSRAISVSAGVAYVAGSDGVHTLHVEDPADLSRGSFIDLPSGAADLLVSDDLAYVVGGENLFVLDISDPESPSIRSSIGTPGAAKGVAISGGLGYVAGENRLHIVEVEDSDNPSLLGSVTRRLLFSSDSPFPFVSDFADVTVSGETVWVAGGLDIWSVAASSCRGSQILRRGDCKDDGTVDISDAVFSLGSLFLGDGDPTCDDACDSNDDGTLDISDPIVTLQVLFLGNGVIPPPGMTDCGVDPTDDELGCETEPASCQ